MFNIYFLNLFDEALIKNTKSLERTMGFKAYIGRRDVNDTEMKNQIRWCEDEKMDAIVCEWLDYEKIMSHKPMVPVYPVTLNAHDTTVILFLLKKHLQENGLEHYKKVILGTYLPINIKISLLEEMFGFEILNPPWEDNLSQSYFDAYAKEGYQVVVCGPQHAEKVRNSGMYPFHDKRVYEYVDFLGDIKKVVERVAERTQLQRALNEMRNMINYSFEAICILDNEGRITACNDQAKSMFTKNETDEYVGEYFYKLVPAVSRSELEDILNKGKSYYSRVINTGDLIGMLNLTPNSDKKRSNGAVVHFTTIQQIEKMENQVKSEFYKKGHYAKYRFVDILGESAVMVKTKKLAERFSKYNSNILLYGESGCGKELFAQSMHNSSLRAEHPFVAVNCGALPSNLLESELFGYVEGAFTGALKKGKKGLFEIANKGTIFLDEISEMDLQSQTRLLRVLEERSVMRIGDDKVVPVDVRVIAASNKNLVKQVKEGNFREDLYYRLNVLALNIPSLRERGRDVVLIADNYIGKYGKQYNKPIVLSKEAENEIMLYPWEGNVRQLRNFCERLVIVAESKEISSKEIQEQFDVIEMSQLDEDKVTSKNINQAGNIDGIDNMAEAEKISIKNALLKSNGNREQTAARLGISKSTLWRKMKYYGIE